MSTTISDTAERTRPPASRRRGRVWLKRIGLGLLVLLVAVPLLGATYQLVATRLYEANSPPPGQMVDVGGYSLHLLCTGANKDGSPTVILENGLGGISPAWAWVQPEVARATRVCAYDRAGMGWSDPSPNPRDAQHIAQELHTLLEKANIPGRYVLAGWSYGGLYARVYAGQYPEEVAGVVLLDSSSPEQCTSTPAGQAQCASSARIYSIAPVLVRLGVLRVMGLFKPASGLPASHDEGLRASYAATKDMDAQSGEYLASSETNAQVLSAGSLGAVPLFVLTATDHGTPPDLEQLWQDWQQRLTALSTNSVQRILPNATHSSLMLDSADARDSSAAILQVVEAARTSRPLALTAAPAMTEGPDFAAIDAYVEAQLKDARIPGVALAIVHGDQIVHMKGFGVAASNGRPMTPQTPVNLASLVKPMTGLAVMQLVEAGKIDLDAPVQRYLPWFRVADEAASAQITVRHLLYHTSGLPESAGSNYGLSGDDRADALEQQVRELRSVTLADPVGAAYHYSNPNYGILGLLIQEITGQSYEAYMQEHVFAPLEMRETFTSPEVARQHEAAQGYRFLFGTPVPFDEPYNRGGLPSGGAIASAEDVARFLIVNLNDGRYGDEQLVSAPGMAEMQRPVVEAGNEFEAWDWGVQSIDGTQVLTKGGDLASYKTNMALFPDRKTGFVLLINANDRWSTRLQDLRVSGMAIGISSLMLGQQPPNLASTGPLIFRLIVALVALLQAIGIFLAVRTFRRWSRHPESRPRGARGQVRHIALPLILSLIWGLVLLVVVPRLLGGYPLSFLLYVVPDLAYFLVVSGGIALVWGLLRTVLAYRAIRAGNAPRLFAEPAQA